MELGGWEAEAPSSGKFFALCLVLSGILLDAILANFSRVQHLGLPLKMVMYSAVSLWEGRQCHVGTGMGAQFGCERTGGSNGTSA